MDSSSDSNKCVCDSVESDCSQSESSSPTSNKEKKKLSLTSLGFSLRRGRSLQFKTAKRSSASKKSNTHGSTSEASSSSSMDSTSTKTRKSPKWPLKFSIVQNCTKKSPSKSEPPAAEAPSCCRCMCYRRTEEHHLGAGVVFTSDDKTISNDMAIARSSSSSDGAEAIAMDANSAHSDEDSFQQQGAADMQPIIHKVPVNANNIYGPKSQSLLGSIQMPLDMSWMRTVHEDCDEAARRQRAREMEQGVEPPANFRSTRRVQLLCSDVETEDGALPRRLQLVCPSDLSVESLRAIFQTHVMLQSCPVDVVPGCHTQVDFVHCLVPDLLSITNSTFYWGKMDRYEAERLLDGKPEGTFLLRDSAQEEFLFSVSFRKYGRSLHARIEQWNHKFSFDSHDPSVYTADTICGLIENYKDPSSCMFFEPMLTWPLHRKSAFSLTHLCRAVITSRVTYDNVNKLQLPKVLKMYLKEYHYRQKVRVERFDDDVQWLDLLNVQLP